MRTAAELFAEPPRVTPKVYAYSIHDQAHHGLLKIGETSRDVRLRVAEQLRTAAIENYSIVVEEVASRIDGSIFRDRDVRSALSRKGFRSVKNEWMECSVDDVRTAIAEIRSGLSLQGARNKTFEMRKEQRDAVDATYNYFTARWKEDAAAVPRFLWNAKMRFGKTFAAYHLAKRIRATRILVVTFKPAVEDAWQRDLEQHVEFRGWRYLSRNVGIDPGDETADEPIVVFGSFQDLLGKTEMGKAKPKNEWIHNEKWDIVIFDEYHFGAWRDTSKELFQGEESSEIVAECKFEYGSELQVVNDNLASYSHAERDFVPISARAYLYLSGTPFKALATGEFIEEQIFNWTYTDEQAAKANFAVDFPDRWNPYQALPEMRLLTYSMPDELVAVASGGEFDEFDLDHFFSASGLGADARFEHEVEVLKWLGILRGRGLLTTVERLKGAQPRLPYDDPHLLAHTRHSLWFLPDVAACDAMANLLRDRRSDWREYEVVVAAGAKAGVGLQALGPVRKAIGSGFDTKTITLSCAKLTTGVTVPQWSSILMLRNLKSPETYFQAAFRVQSPWSMLNPEGDKPNEEIILKPVCFVFDFAPTRALRQFAEYGIGLASGKTDPELAVVELVSFLPVLAYDGGIMHQVSAGEILDYAMAGTSATLLARKWQSALLVNVDNDTLRRVLADADAMAAVARIDGWRALGGSVLETVISKSEKVKEIKTRSMHRDLSSEERKELKDAEREYRRARNEVQEKLKKFAGRIPAFMYLTDFRENTLRDVITKIEPELFFETTGLTVADFNKLVDLRVFNTERMNQAVFAFRRYEEASLRYTGLDSNSGVVNYGLYDTVVAK